MKKVRKGVEKMGGKTVYHWDKYRGESKMAEGQEGKHRIKGSRETIKMPSGPGPRYLKVVHSTAFREINIKMWLSPICGDTLQRT